MNEMKASNAGDRPPEMVIAARALGPLIEAHRQALAEGPDLPPQVADAVIQGGFGQLWLPRAFGGRATHPLEFVQAVEALARLDASVAWCAQISSAASRFFGQMAAEPMRRLLPAGTMLGFSGSAHPTGSLTRDGQGWRINGRWSWASFSRYSVISGLMCIEQENDAPRLEDGRPVQRFALLPSRMVQVMGNWNGDGLRSSGSHDVVCTDVWVPDDCTTTMEMPNRQPDPLSSLPFASSAAIGVMGLPLGIAAASIDALADLAQTKVAFFSPGRLCEQENVQLEVARAKTRLQAARAFAFEAVGSIWASISSGQPASIEQQAMLRMACWNAGDAGKEVVGRMYAAAGSTAVLKEAPFAAQLRDVHAACQHINFATRLMVPPGRVLLGLEPGVPMI